MEVIAVLIAAAAGYAAAAGLQAGLGAAFRRAADLSAAEAAARRRRTLPHVTALAAALLTAGLLRHAFVVSGVSGADAGAVAGLGLGAFVAAPWIAAAHAFAGRRAALVSIDVARAVICCGVIGLVLGALG
jgi:hypothetical protein